MDRAAVRTVVLLLASALGAMLPSASMSRAQNGSPNQSIVGDVSPPRIVLEHGEDTGHAKLRLKVMAEFGHLLLEAWAVNLGDGVDITEISDIAEIKGEIRDIAQVDIEKSGALYRLEAYRPNSWKRLQLKVDDLGEYGTYVGKVVVRNADGEVVSLHDFKILRPAPRFAPELEGEGVADGRLSLRRSVFWPETFNFTVKIPEASSTRRIRFCFQEVRKAGSSTCDAPGVRITPDPARVDPEGGGSPVKVAVDGSAKFDGLLWLIDAQSCPDGSEEVDECHLRTAVPAMILPPAWDIVLWVAIGAILSVMLNQMLPASRTKRSNYNRIMELRSKIQSSTEPGADLRMVLNAEQHRIRGVNSEIFWFSPGKKERFDEVNQLIENLARKVDLVARLSALREYFRREGIIPQSRRQRDIDCLLLQSEGALVDGDLDEAESKLDEADKKKSEPETDGAGDRRSELAKRIRELPAQKPERPPYIQNLILKLRSKLQKGNKIDPAASDEGLPQLEHEYAKAALYEVLEQTLCDHDFGEQELKLKYDFSRRLAAEDFYGARSLLSVRITPHEICETLDKINSGNLGARIRVEPVNPEERQSAVYEVEFDEPRLNYLEARRLVQFVWDFGDGTARTRGVRCVHHFPLTVLWRNPLRRLQRLQLVKGSYERTVSVEMSASDDERESTAKTDTKVRVRGPTKRSVGLTLFELFSFVLVTAVAVISAFGAEYANLVGESTYSTWLTAFLFGFGLDQIRDRTVNPAQP